MELFTVTCPTCKARLKVRDQTAIGKILECPKCESMLEVKPPAGWQPPKQPAGPPREDADRAIKSSPAPPPAERPAPGATQPAQDQASATERPATELPKKGIAALAAAGIDLTGEPAAAAPAESAAAASPTAAASASAAEVLGGKLVAASVAAALLSATALGIWMFAGGSSDPPPPEPVAAAPAESPPEAPPAAPEKAPGTDRLPLRWMPRDTRLALSWPGIGAAGKFDWQTKIGLPGSDDLQQVIDAVGVAPRAVHRITWCCTDAEPQPRRGVAILQLAAPLPADAGLADDAELLSLRLGQGVCRRRPRSLWPHPFALVDAQTVVTGPRELLETLAAETGAADAAGPLAGSPLAALADVDPAYQAVLLADRQAWLGQPHDITWFEFWEAGRAAWQTLRSTTQAAALAVRHDGKLHAELRLVADGRSGAEQLQAALARLQQAAPELLRAERQSLTARLQQGQITGDVAGQMDLLLAAGLEASDGEVGAEDNLVWLRTGAAAEPAPLAAALESSVPAWEAARLATARGQDEAHGRLLVRGLVGYNTAEKQLPASAWGSTALPPEDRLSWLAELLPYYDKLQWHQQLNRGLRWNDPDNLAISRQPFPEVVNPALPTRKTQAGFPVTHYVGVAGWGADAAELDADHPRAGLFGNQRRVRLERLGKGASQTVAVLGVSSQLGPWAQGGRATVRGVTAAPLVGGPDGFGSGQPEGVLAAMADGSVRVLSADIDPEVLRQLVTINGYKPPPRVAVVPNSSDGGAPPEPVPMPMPVVRDPLPAVDVEAHLARKLVAIEYEEIKLSDLLNFLSQLSAVPMTLDLEALQDSDVAPDTPVSVRLRDATIESVLAAALGELNLEYVVEEGHVLITTAARNRSRLTTVVYSLDGLAAPRPGAGGGTPQDYAALVRRLVEPASWQDRGGPGTIEVTPGGLAVRQSPAVHGDVLSLLERLRLARGRRPLTSGDRFALQTRFARAKGLLAKPVTANFSTPTRLGRILNYLQDRSGANLLIDAAALGEVGLSRDTETTLVVNEQPFLEALVQLSRTLKVSFRVLDASTVQLTSRDVADARLDLEFYSLKGLPGGLTGGQRAAAVMDRIAPASWSDAGGRGVIHFDGPSNCLLVLHSQGVQFQIEQLLHQWRQEAGSRP